MTCSRKYAPRGDLKIYNKVIKTIASDSTSHLGVDTVRSRVAMARWCKRLRKEYPFRDQFPEALSEALRKPVGASGRVYG